MHDLGVFLILIPVTVVSIAVFVNSSEILPRTFERINSGSYVSGNPQSDQSTAASDSTKNPLTKLFSGGLGSGAQFDLDGPLACDYKDEAADFTIRILDKNIYVQIKEEDKTTKILVKDGTLYKWIQGEYVGEKIVNIGQYLTLFDTFSAFLTPDMVLSMISKVNESTALTQPQIQNLKESCLAVEVDPDIFTVPRGVRFEEITMQEINDPERFEID